MAESATRTRGDTIGGMSVGQRVVAGIAAVALALCVGYLLVPFQTVGYSRPTTLSGLPDLTKSSRPYAVECDGPLLVWVQYDDPAEACSDKAKDVALGVLPFAAVAAISLGGIYALVSYRPRRDQSW
jgi:hypothetical protein